MKVTQQQVILEKLREAGSFGVHSFALLDAHIPRAAARVLDLRRQGYEISSTREKSGGAVGVRYRLIKEPVEVGAGTSSGVDLGESPSGPQPSSGGYPPPDARVKSAESSGALFELEPEAPVSAITGKKQAA